MSELLGWIIVAGLALVIVGLFLLSSQISEHMRVVAHMIVGNKQILDRPAAVNQTSPQPEPEIQPEKIVERRALNRRDPINQLMRAIAEDVRRHSPGRRLDDLLSADAAGYSPD